MRFTVTVIGKQWQANYWLLLINFVYGEGDNLVPYGDGDNLVPYANSDVCNTLVLSKYPRQTFMSPQYPSHQATLKKI